MNTLLVFVANKLFELIWPKLEKAISENLDEWLPKIVKAVVVAVSQSAGQLVVDTADKVTDVIPGKVDDYVVEPLLIALGKRWDSLEFVSNALCP